MILTFNVLNCHADFEWDNEDEDYRREGRGYVYESVESDYAFGTFVYNPDEGLVESAGLNDELDGAITDYLDDYFYG